MYLTAIVEFGYIGPHAKWGSRLRDSRGESIRDLQKEKYWQH